MSDKNWFSVDKDGLPQQSGTYICITRGATSLKLMRYKKEEKDSWSFVGQGGSSNKVTNWAKIPDVPFELKMNILLKKASNEGLEDDEKLELAKLLEQDAK